MNIFYYTRGDSDVALVLAHSSLEAREILGLSDDHLGHLECLGPIGKFSHAGLLFKNMNHQRAVRYFTTEGPGEK